MDFDFAAITNDYILPWSINIGLALLIFIVGRMAAGLIVKVAERLLTTAGVDPTLIGFITAVAHAVLILFVIIAALDKLGVDTTTFIALIGAAGLAIGLSLKSSLENFAAGVMLIVFRPFKVGDVVDAGGVLGVVEKISVFHTIMRTGDNREVIVPNGAIYGGNITNNNARETRRIDLVFGIGYESDLLKAKKILQNILASDERILSEPAPLVAVAALADSSVNFNVRPWVKSSDYWEVYYSINEKVKLSFAENDISIPYPQMDIHLSKSE